MVSVQEQISRAERATATGVYRWLFGFVVALIITLGALALSIYLTRDQVSFERPYTPKPYVSDEPKPEPKPGTK